MKKFQEALYNLAVSDLPTADVADTLFRSSRDLNDDELPVWVMNNANELQKVLQFPSVMDDNVSQWKRDMMNEFFELRNRAVTASRDEQLDIMGNKRRPIDEYMTAFGYQTADGKPLSDDDRSAFTNPENPKYWGNSTPSEKEAAAITLGKKNFSEIEGDLRRSGDEYQTRNRVEGYGPDNEFELLPWISSSILGLGAPRVKEAKAAGRDVTWQDIAGDFAELGLNFVPGVGIADKAGTVVLKMPGLKSDLARTLGEKIAFGAGFAGESVAQPALSQLLDANVLYNPEVLGEPTSSLNPRSEVSLDRLAAQTAGIGMGKGVVKSFGPRLKNSLEQSMGDQGGGNAYKTGFKDFVGSIGSKTDDIIARRQAMLERKAELAVQNAKLRPKADLGNAPLKKSEYGADNLIDAENYRVLRNEAKRIADNQKATNRYAANDDNWVQYRLANETGRSESLVQLPDGRVIPTAYLGDEGFKFGNVQKKLDGVTPLEYIYDDPGSISVAPNPEKWKKYNYVARNSEGVPEIRSRNAAVQEQIEKYPELARKMRGATWLKETARDAAANAAYNMFAREGYANVGGRISSIKDIDEKRQKALWNSMLGKLRDFTANPRISVDDRKKYADAIMNVMTYGLDGLTTEQFRKYPQIYHNIAIKLGVDEWKHPSEIENNPIGKASTSSAEPMSSASAY